MKINGPAYPEWLARPPQEPPLALAFTAASQFANPANIDTLMLFSDERGENQVVQFDGPSMAYYELTINGFTTRYTYQSVRWQSDSMAKLVKRAKEWADGIRAAGEHIIWRRRPEVWLDTASGKYVFDCRLHVMPYRDIPEAVHPGHITPEA